jgi:hypothetical protein
MNTNITDADFRSMHPSEADYQVSEQFSFYGVRLASRPTPHPEDRLSLFVWLLPLDLFGMGVPTSSYATAGIVLWVSGGLKPHHHDNVKTPSVGKTSYGVRKIKIRPIIEVLACEKEF